MANAALVDGTPKLEKLTDLQLPMAAPLETLRGSARAQPPETTFDGEDSEHTLFLQAIAGRPWYPGQRDVPTSLLTEEQTHNMLTRLGLMHISLAIVLLLGFIRSMMRLYRRLA